MRKIEKKHSAIANYKNKAQKDKKAFFFIAAVIFVALFVGKIAMNYSVYYIVFGTLASIIALFGEDIPFFKDSNKDSYEFEDKEIQNDATIASDITRQ